MCNALTVVGWVGLVPVLSTPLSFGVTLVFYGVMLGILPPPTSFDVLLYVTASSFAFQQCLFRGAFSVWGDLSWQE